MTFISLEEAQARLGELVAAARRGDEVVITEEDRPAGRLVPIASAKPRPRFGSEQGKITMRDDFDEPLEEFEEYMQ